MKLPPEDARGLSPKIGRPEDSYSKGVKNTTAGLKQLGSSALAVKSTAFDGYIATGNALAQVKVGRMELRNLKLPSVGLKAWFLLAPAIFLARDGIHQLAAWAQWHSIIASAVAWAAYKGNRAAANALFDKKAAVDAKNDPEASLKFEKQLRFWIGPGRYAANGIALGGAISLVSGGNWIAEQATPTFASWGDWSVEKGLAAFFVAALMWGITGTSNRLGFSGAAQQIIQGKPRPGSKLGFLKRSKAPSKDVPTKPVAPTPTPPATDGPGL